MSYHSHSSMPTVQPSPVAQSPKMSTAGLGNELNASKKRNGYLSTFFGRRNGGFSERQYSSLGEFFASKHN